MLLNRHSPASRAQEPVPVFDFRLSQDLLFNPPPPVPPPQRPSPSPPGSSHSSPGQNSMSSFLSPSDASTIATMSGPLLTAGTTTPRRRSVSLTNSLRSIRSSLSSLSSSSHHNDHASNTSSTNNTQTSIHTRSRSRSGTKDNRMPCPDDLLESTFFSTPAAIFSKSNAQHNASDASSSSLRSRRRSHTAFIYTPQLPVTPHHSSSHEDSSHHRHHHQRSSSSSVSSSAFLPGLLLEGRSLHDCGPGGWPGVRSTVQSWLAIRTRLALIADARKRSVEMLNGDTPSKPQQPEDCWVVAVMDKKFAVWLWSVVEERLLDVEIFPSVGVSTSVSVPGAVAEVGIHTVNGKGNDTQGLDVGYRVVDFNLSGNESEASYVYDLNDAQRVARIVGVLEDGRVPSSRTTWI